MLKLIGEDIFYNGIKVAQLVDAPSSIAGEFNELLCLLEGDNLQDVIDVKQLAAEEGEDKKNLIQEIREVLSSYE